MTSCDGCGYAPSNVQPQQAVYQPPQQPYQQDFYQPPKYNGMAIAGFVISIVNIFCMGFLFLFGLIFSIIGLVQTSSSRDLGKGLAIAGIILSALFTVLFIVFWIMIAVMPHWFYF